MALDEIDTQILRLLRENARMSYRELGERVALSATATAERMRRLTEQGVIAGFTVVLDEAAAGRTLVALIDVRLVSPGVAPRFETLLQSMDEVTDVSHVTGRFDYSMRVACRDVDGLEQLLRRLKRSNHVAETDTRIALRTVVRRSGA